MEKRVKERIRDVVKAALADAGFPEQPEEEIQVMPAAREEFGDFYTNIAFKTVDSRHPTPGEVALSLKEKIISSAPDFMEKVEVRNGFLNFFLDKNVYLRMLSGISSSEGKSLTPLPPAGKKALIEFVSANPTGPLTIAHGRQAAFGESLARILKYAGFEVTKEYYLNDSGRQIRLLGESLKARYRQLKGEKECAIPEEGYEGEYLVDMAREIKDDNISFDRFAADRILEDIRMTWRGSTSRLTGGQRKAISLRAEGLKNFSASWKAGGSYILLRAQGGSKAALSGTKRTGWSSRATVHIPTSRRTSPTTGTRLTGDTTSLLISWVRTTTDTSRG